MDASHAELYRNSPAHPKTESQPRHHSDLVILILGSKLVRCNPLKEGVATSSELP